MTILAIYISTISVHFVSTIYQKGAKIHMQLHLDKEFHLYKHVYLLGAQAGQICFIKNDLIDAKISLC